MVTVIHDGSIEGLFSAVYDSWALELNPSAINSEAELEPSLFEERFYVATDRTKGDRLLSMVKKSFSAGSLSNISRCALSCDPGRGMMIYRYFILGLKQGRALDNYLTDDAVDAITKTAHRVGFEAHRFLGLARFRKTEGGIYYSEIRPDNDILPLIAGHFAARMHSERWIIRDINRGRAALHERGGGWRVYDMEVDRPPAHAPDEGVYQELWRVYYREISITERKNSRQQKGYMPVRYWNELIEVPDSSSG
jgi:probable DNA metabolism protein